MCSSMACRRRATASRKTALCPEYTRAAPHGKTALCPTGAMLLHGPTGPHVCPTPWPWYSMGMLVVVPSVLFVASMAGSHASHGSHTPNIAYCATWPGVIRHARESIQSNGVAYAVSHRNGLESCAMPSPCAHKALVSPQTLAMLSPCMLSPSSPLCVVSQAPRVLPACGSIVNTLHKRHGSFGPQ
jgi:hypothetical protein